MKNKREFKIIENFAEGETLEDVALRATHFLADLYAKKLPPKELDRFIEMIESDKIHLKL